MENLFFSIETKVSKILEEVDGLVDKIQNIKRKKKNGFISLRNFLLAIYIEKLINYLQLKIDQKNVKNHV